MNPTTQESDKKNRTVKRNGKSRESFEPENQALQDNSERDWLTQLYKREAMERLCNAWLLAKQTGTFILMDLDSFKRINDRYGHITGDQVLQKVSYVLTKMLPGDSLIGRVSGDEFAVLLSGQDEKKSEQLCTQLRQRLRHLHLRECLDLRLDLTITQTARRPDDTYQSLYDRANQQIREKKSGHNSERQNQAMEFKLREGNGGVTIDMKLIASEMRENPTRPGSFCQDYETFKAIYRFAERKMCRSQESAYLLLFTLTDSMGDFPALSQRDEDMDILGTVIRDQLRLGDVFTQYSSCQYLVLVSGLTVDNADKLADRIAGTFYQKHQDSGMHSVLHYSYPLQPTRVEVKQKK
ncbi:GGDEF domain-containing protein [Holdemania filiformis]|uniref:GGDEF domain-containing protein n=1 Tax=Holdemania filiformis TaxID=61171 RepID=UPI00242C658A|nr:GGDEF domain-containing protein [Holdemania filiformis]MBS5000868.1 GGDEF domain-containing protein [Holdemania filiformis]